MFTNVLWFAVLAVLAAVVLGAGLRPQRFRGYYRFSMRVGFALSQFIGRVALVLLFFLILTPMGLVLRLIGKDALQLKRPRDTATCWSPAKEAGPLDRLF